MRGGRGCTATGTSVPTPRERPSSRFDADAKSERTLIEPQVVGGAARAEDAVLFPKPMTTVRESRPRALLSSPATFPPMPGSGLRNVKRPNIQRSTVPKKAYRAVAMPEGSAGRAPIQDQACGSSAIGKARTSIRKSGLSVLARLRIQSGPPTTA